jgi:ABC-type branched-subunit amino acid transport system substrate-binding protein
MKNVLIGFLLLMVLPLYSQEYQQEYLQGKEFLENGRYSLAMESLKPLVRTERQNPLSKYAMYYYAVAAYKDGFPPLAKDMFLQVQELYPNWQQIDEVKLWLAKIYFEDNRYNQALNALSKIKNRRLKQQGQDMLKFHVFQINDLFLLEQLYDTNPNNEIIAYRYAKKLSEQPFQQRDQELLTRLINKFNFNSREFNAGVIKETVYKEVYKVAVMLPFVYETLDVDTRKKKNQFVLDIYNGIRMAARKLRSQGKDVEIFAYDTRRDYATTAEILEKDEMKSMDLIIGPLYPGPLQIVQDFVFRNKINMINPLSNNPDVINNNPFAFLFKPSYATLGNAIAEYAVEEVRNPYGIILYGESEADSIMAHSYKETFEQSAFEIVLMEKIYAANRRRILDILTTSGKKLQNSDDEEEVELTIAADSVGSIFVASDDDLIITRVFSGIETRKDSMLIFGSEKWLEIKAIDHKALERLGVSMTAPTYYDYSEEEVKRFRENYIYEHRELPSEFAIIGYDLMMFAGTALEKYGKYFQLGLKNAPVMEGFLLTGYNYRESNDNKVVPIVKVIDNEPQIVVIKNYAANE